MLGKTHLAVGIATAITIIQPSTVPELIVGISAAAIGSLISDIDIDSTEAHREADRIIAGAIGLVVLIAAIEKYFNIGITQRLLANSNMVRIIIGTLVFLVIMAYGKQTKHRTFMHSLLALISMSICLYIVFPIIVPYFAIAFLSHILIDLLNMKKVKVFYPIKKGYALKLCHAKGLVNSILFVAGIIISVVMIAKSIVLILV